MRPAVSPAGSRITASVSDSQTSLSPRRIGTSRSPDGRAGSERSSRWSTSGTVRPSASSDGTPVIRSAAAFQSTIRSSRSTATIPSATLPRIATLRSRSSSTCW